MSDITAEFEPGIWQDFSKGHAALREEVEQSLSQYRDGKSPGPIAVWGAFGAGKTQFLFWVAEKAMELGLIPVYFHLNDLIDALPDNPSPDVLKNHARAFVNNVVQTLRNAPGDESLLKIYRDEALLSYISERLAQVDIARDERPVLLIDEVEQAYKSLSDSVRADDRSPLRAWLEEKTFKVCAFAVGSLYVLGRADRERLQVWPIPAVRPSYAKSLFPGLPETSVNALWWLSRGKPRHLMKAARRLQSLKPKGTVEISEYLKDLDSVSQAPYESDSQNVVPAAYTDQLEPAELATLLTIGPETGGGEGKLFCLDEDLERELLIIVREAFKMEAVALDVVRYIILLLEAVSVDERFALSQADTPFLLRLAVDFLLEYERERLEKETIEGGASLRKLLEVHDTADQRAAEVFWKLHGTLKATDEASSSISFEAMASAFPLPTTSPTLFGTKPSVVRATYEDTKQPVFSWRDSAGNTVVFLTSVGALVDYSDTDEFRRCALAPKTGMIVLLPHDAEEWQPSGFLHWLAQHERLHVLHLPLALTDFLLSLRDYAKEGTDPFPVAEQAESQQNLQRQVAFYRSRLRSYVDDATCRARVVTPNDIPRRFTEVLSRVADKEVLALTTRQAFEGLSPQVQGFLVDLRELVTNTKALWGRGGYISIADDMLPHRSPRTERVEAAKMLDDMKAVFSSYLDSLRSLVTFVDEQDIEYLSDDAACKIALRSLWQTKRGSGGGASEALGRYSAQLNDIVATLQKAKETESKLTAIGLLADFGNLGILMESLPSLEKVTNATAELLKAHGGADRRLAATLFERFLEALIEAVVSEVSKTKATLSRIGGALENLEDTKARIVEAATCDASRFVDISSTSIAGLVSDLSKMAAENLGSNPTPEDIAKELEGIQQDYEHLEALMVRLDDSYREIKMFTVGQV